MKELTDQVWKDALEKWSPGHDHNGHCGFCKIYGNNTVPNNNCITSGCPLADPASGASICCGGTWIKWSSSQRFRDSIAVANNALAVHDFIATKYIEWLENNKTVKEPEKTLLERLEGIVSRQGFVTFVAEEIMFFAGDIGKDFVAVLGRDKHVDFVVLSRYVMDNFNDFSGVGWVSSLNLYKRDDK